MNEKIIDVGDTVLCDMCNGDYTDSDAEGGFMLMSNGVCPECADRVENSCRQYGEEKYITERARPGETFKAFILRMRGGNNTVRIMSF